jgi:hypothetical protein
MPALLIAILLLAVSLARGASNATGIDPVDNYCSRLYHQSTVKNKTLYIDGGLEVFVGRNNNGTPEGARVLGYSMLSWCNFKQTRIGSADRARHRLDQG